MWLQLNIATRQAALSTASGGKFDRKAVGERPQDRQQARSRKNKYTSVADKASPHPFGSLCLCCVAPDIDVPQLHQPASMLGSTPMSCPVLCQFSHARLCDFLNQHASTLRLPPGLRACLQGGAEREQQTKTVDHILRRNADDIVDVGKAISKLERESREERSAAKGKKGGGKAMAKGGAKGGGKGAVGGGMKKGKGGGSSMGAASGGKKGKGGKGRK